MPRSVVGLLAEQPDEELTEMETGIRDEIRRLQTELELVEQARSKKSRKRGGRSRGTTHGTGNGARTITREQVLEIVRASGVRLQPAQVRDGFAAKGIETNPDAVRQHLRRLRIDGILEVTEEGYKLASTNGNGTLLGPPGG